MSFFQKKLNRLNELDRTLHALSDQIAKLQNDKAKLEVSIKKAKLSFSFGMLLMRLKTKSN